VANVRGYVNVNANANANASAGALTVPPRYVAESAMGEGFAEIASEILRKR
jgi:hypothetical protein